jgi:hypothetical protein
MRRFLRAILEASAPLLARRAAPLPLFPFYPQDFLFATRLFTREERALYFELLCYQWMQGSLPIELDQLATLLAVKFERIKTSWTRANSSAPTNATMAARSLRVRDSMRRAGWRGRFHACQRDRSDADQGRSRRPYGKKVDALIRAAK